jgi:microcystin-dependent protein
MIIPYVGKTEPTGWLFCYGQSLSRTTYAALFAVIAPSLGTATITNASPGVVTLNSHGLQNGDPVIFTTTGSLPTGITANTTYFVYNKTANTFQLTTARLNAGTVVNTSSSGSGTHTVRYVPFGVPDTSNFYAPDLRGRVPAGTDGMGGTLANVLANQYNGGIFGNTGATGGEPGHLLTAAESGLPAHGHQARIGNVSPGDGSGFRYSNNDAGLGSVQIQNNTAASASNSHNIIQPTTVVNYLIAT